MAPDADPTSGQRRQLPLAAVLALALSTSAIGATLLLLLARAWRETSGGLTIDHWAASLAAQGWNGPFANLMQTVTHLGDPATLTVIGAAFAVFLLWRRQPAFALGWLSALAGNAWLNPTLKAVFSRLRPTSDSGLSAAIGYSFPSGHSSGAMVTYGMFAYLVWRMSARRRGVAICGLAIAVILAVGASRVYLGVHFLSDVLAGYASGAAWLALVVAAVEVWCATRKSPSH